MAITVASTSSTSSFSFPAQEKHDVFLSFRGKDTRNGFVSHLHNALRQKKIKIYIDEKSLKRGDEISPSLLQAIRNSKVSVIIFSKNYASSPWCLTELLQILKCRQKNGQFVLPIFYEVDPSHVRKQEGSYRDALVKHEETFKDRMDMVLKWRAALTTSANLSGFDSQAIRPESKLIEVIVEVVLKELCSTTILSSDQDFQGQIGMEKHFKQIELLLRVSSPNVLIIGIWGMGGIGKTTLVEALFNRLFSQYESCYFLKHVREESKKYGLEKLRVELIAKLLKEENLNFGTPSIPDYVRQRLRRTKALIVLDDVSNLEQLEVLVGDRALSGDQFGYGSRIIITTRDAKVLRAIGADEIYEVEQLNYDESLQLFNLITFRGNSPKEEYTELSKKVMDYVGGNPLAIKILGSHLRSLRSPSKENWEMTLDKLKEVPHIDIQNVLIVSYEGLDEKEKSIFLDIACFFKKMCRRFVENILNGCGFFASIGIDSLVDKSLITVNHRNELHMHDLVQEMGWKIVREESNNLQKRSRLWIARDISHVLKNDKGTTTLIEGIFLDTSMLAEKLYLRPTVFQGMHNLRLLNIYSSSLGTIDMYSPYNINKCKVYLYAPEFLPPSLRYLKWHGYPLKSLPSNFKPRNLVELDMPFSQLEQLWNGVQDLNKLKGIDLRHSVRLTHIPNLSLAPNLERINLEYCTSLLQLPLNSLQNLNKLVDLNLGHCKQLRSLPQRIDATTLRTLDLKGCSMLKTLPEIITRSLVSLNLGSTAIEYLPSSIGFLNNLSSLVLNDCKSLTNMPSSMCKLESMKVLKLSGCLSLEMFPKLPANIEELDLCGTAIKEVPSSSIEHCFSLKIIKMSDCKRLENLPTSISKLRSLRNIYLNQCSNLKEFPEISEPMESLKYLSLDGTRIRQLPSSVGNVIGIEELDQLQNIYENLESVPNINYNLNDIESHKFHNCCRLDYAPHPIGFRFLTSLHLSDSDILEIPQSIIRLWMLKGLFIQNCKYLVFLPALPMSLEQLDASGCTSLEMVSNSNIIRNSMKFLCYPMQPALVLTKEFSVFSGCLKLDQNARDNMITEFQLRVWRLTTRFGPVPNYRPIVRACVPGNEIPDWFNYSSEGHTFEIKLQPQWNNTGFLGFVVCVVIPGIFDSNKRIQGVGCSMKFRSNDGQSHSIHWPFHDFTDAYSFRNFSTSNHDHVLMWYYRQCYEKCHDAVDASFYFVIHSDYDRGKNWLEHYEAKVKRCGIRMLYHQDLKEFNFIDIKEAAAIVNRPESSAINEQHPKKRTKFFSL